MALTPEERAKALEILIIDNGGLINTWANTWLDDNCPTKPELKTFLKLCMEAWLKGYEVNAKAKSKNPRR